MDNNNTNNSNNASSSRDTAPGNPPTIPPASNASVPGSQQQTARTTEWGAPRRPLRDTMPGSVRRRNNALVARPSLRGSLFGPQPPTIAPPSGEGNALPPLQRRLPLVPAPAVIGRRNALAATRPAPAPPQAVIDAELQAVAAEVAALSQEEALVRREEVAATRRRQVRMTDTTRLLEEEGREDYAEINGALGQKVELSEAGRRELEERLGQKVPKNLVLYLKTV